MNAAAKTYDTVAITLHWFMALTAISLITLGSYMTGLDKTDPAKFQLIGLHKSFGVIFMQLAIIRVIWSRISRGPELPTVLNRWEKGLSQTITVTLYLLMFAIPLSGYAMSNLFGHSVSLFGVLPLPVLFSEDPELGMLAKQAHIILVYCLLIALFAHIAGALKHRFLDSPEADVLPRMLPIIKPRN
ncbi:cytochrome b [Bacterioplanoides sp. SCSIO 12839]|uniref:cytochrome b n=1 Tax=Bacterioplanoides sp. SCSIO 12839 TaxID=2829569 RepID=UPI002104BFF2|nr:cytochrome b [Bacterioplanoides sp. SCSIO 12839]